jgi:DNA-binding response OmpR family regulator
MVSKNKILIVDDDSNIAELISLYLAKECFDTQIVGDGESALRTFKTYQPDLILLDLMLPGIDGYQVCREVRSSSDTPVIMLSAKGEVFDKVLGLELGADDYIEKPYDIDILMAKIHGIFKRRYSHDELRDGNLRLDRVNRTAYKDDAPLTLTAKEFDLLLLLMENKGKPMTKEYLFSQVWGSDSFSELQTLTVHIKWLRQKIEDDPKDPQKILTVWGKGYRYI